MMRTLAHTILLIAMITSSVFGVAVNYGVVGNARTPFSVANGKDRDMEQASIRLYQNAIDLYKKKEYWKASRELIVILDFYSEFSRIDGVIFHTGECLYEMNMYRSADKLYQYLIKNYPDSKFLTACMLGLQKINYNVGEYQKSLEFYQSILKNYPDNPVIDGVHYYGGMSYYHTEQYEAAVEAFSKIDNRSDFFDYGLYTTALAFLKRKNIDQATKIFRTLVDLPIVRQERQDLIRAAHLTLGYLYYELGYFREAIKHYAKIPNHDDIYPEALLASSWASIKLSDFQHAIITLNELVKRSDDPKFNEEAHFLLGQCYLELGFYDFAIQEFDYILKRYPGQENVEARVKKVKDGLVEQRQIAENMRVRLILLESDLLSTIPLDELNEIPLYLKQEQDRVEKTRNNLIEKIIAERQVFDDMQWELLKLREEIYMKQSRQHWRAYSEYGKARAYFLKTMP